jgi:hypothetical protein
MSEVQCFTSASFAYLDRVRVLSETLRRHHPDWTLTLCLSDEPPPGFSFDPSRKPIDRIVRIGELDFPDLRNWMFEHDVVEPCAAVKGQMLCRLLEQGARKVVYLDPDIAVLGDLGDVEDLLDRYNVVLTPHQVEPDDTIPAIRDNEIGSLKFGIYNLGFLAVAGCPSCRYVSATSGDSSSERRYAASASATAPDSLRACPSCTEIAARRGAPSSTAW